jgi:hypothetical protein
MLLIRNVNHEAFLTSAQSFCARFNYPSTADAVARLARLQISQIASKSRTEWAKAENGQYWF